MTATDISTIPVEFNEVADICAATDVVIGGRTVIGIADARDLHNGLQVGRRYTTWIQNRISKYGFRDGVDYEKIVENQGSRNGEPDEPHIYRLTIDMAKELAMVENNDRGRLIRRYYIWLENYLRELTPAAIDAKTIGGVMKSVIGKQLPAMVEDVARRLLAEQMPAIVGAAIAADPRRAALPYMTSLDIAKQENVPARKRRGLINSMTARLRKYCHDWEIWPIQDGRGVWMFPRSVIGPWLDHEGRKLIADHLSKVNGSAAQMVLNLDAARQRKASESPVRH